MLGNIFVRQHSRENDLILPRKEGLTFKKTICLKCQTLFYGKSKKNIINLSAELGKRVVKVKFHILKLSFYLLKIEFL